MKATQNLIMKEGTHRRNIYLESFYQEVTLYNMTLPVLGELDWHCEKKENF